MLASTGRNFEIGDNYIRFEENLSKTLHGVLLDLKYEPRVVKRVCHEVGQKHDPDSLICTICILVLLRFLGKVWKLSILSQTQKNSFDKCPVGINSLNKILLDMCKAAGVRRKTAHCLCVTCASSLFHANVDCKSIRDRTEHRSDASLKKICIRV